MTAALTGDAQDLGTLRSLLPRRTRRLLLGIFMLSLAGFSRGCVRPISIGRRQEPLLHDAFVDVAPSERRRLCGRATGPRLPVHGRFPRLHRTPPGATAEVLPGGRARQAREQVRDRRAARRGSALRDRPHRRDRPVRRVGRFVHRTDGDRLLPAAAQRSRCVPGELSREHARHDRANHDPVHELVPDRDHAGTRHHRVAPARSPASRRSADRVRVRLWFLCVCVREDPWRRAGHGDVRDRGRHVRDRGIANGPDTGARGVRRRGRRRAVLPHYRGGVPSRPRRVVPGRRVPEARPEACRATAHSSRSAPSCRCPFW